MWHTHTGHMTTQPPLIKCCQYLHIIRRLTHPLLLCLPTGSSTPPVYIVLPCNIQCGHTLSAWTAVQRYVQSADPHQLLVVHLLELFVFPAAVHGASCGHMLVVAGGGRHTMAVLCPHSTQEEVMMVGLSCCCTVWYHLSVEHVLMEPAATY